MTILPSFRAGARIAVTLLVTVAAVGGGLWLWDYYMNEPWTRDGRVRADIVQISSDVAGLVTDVRVADNQLVHKGEVTSRTKSMAHQPGGPPAKSTTTVGSGR